MSGYRASEDLEFHFTTAYADAWTDLRHKVERGERSDSIADSVGVVMSLDEVAGAFLFDWEIFDTHFDKGRRTPGEVPTHPNPDSGEVPTERIS